MVFKYLVVDSGAIISGNLQNLHDTSEKLVTIQEVYDEIRDKKARDLLARFVTPIEIRLPSPQSLKTVIDFAKRTGDYSSLSITDLKLIALTHSLEIEINGNKNLRQHPQKISLLTGLSDNSKTADKSVVSDEKISTSDSNRTKAKELNNQTVGYEEVNAELSIINVRGIDENNAIVNSNEIYSSENDVNPIKSCIILSDIEISVENNNDVDSNDGDILNEAEVDDISEIDIMTSRSSDHNVHNNVNSDIFTNKIDNNSVLEAGIGTIGQIEISNMHSESITRTLQEDKKSVNPQLMFREEIETDIEGNMNFSRILSSQSGNAITYDNVRDDDDGMGWITVDNISNVRHLNTIKTINHESSKKFEKVSVACMTGDFAMQNVLMQIGLHITAFDGKLIHTIKQWILRCNGCYKIHYDLEKLFCNKCGLSNLSKISAHIDSKTGELKLHLKKNYHINLRGTKYSIPKPNLNLRNRFDGDLLLREDQLFTGIWKQKSMSIRKNIASAFGDEITSDVGLQINKGNRIVVGYGKKNPNAMKGRERRGKK